MSKITKSELQSRISAIFVMRLDGRNGREIVQHAATERWGVRDRQIYNYIQKADRLIETGQQKTRDQILEKTRKRLERLYAKSIADADLRLARLVLKDIREFEGLDAKNDVYTRKELFEWWSAGIRAIRGELGDDLADRVKDLMGAANQKEDLSNVDEEAEHFVQRNGGYLT